MALEAHNQAENHHRAYLVEVGQDLLCDWVVTIRFGRTASPGRALSYAFQSHAAARRFVQTRLRRRLTAKRRIGCPYRLIYAVTGEEEGLASWIPDELVLGDALSAKVLLEGAVKT